MFCSVHKLGAELYFSAGKLRSACLLKKFPAGGFFVIVKIAAIGCFPQRRILFFHHALGSLRTTTQFPNRSSFSLSPESRSSYSGKSENRTFRLLSKDMVLNFDHFYNFGKVYPFFINRFPDYNPIQVAIFARQEI